MSRIANNPISIPSGVEINNASDKITVKGKLGELSLPLTGQVDINVEDGVITFKAANESQKSKALSGTVRAIVNNMVAGVSQGFEKKLNIVGVGYRAKAEGTNKLNLTLGFSHPVVFEAPEGITIETPTQTEIVVKGADRQVVGQVAANIREYRSPEPYKGKGVRYADEHVVRKQAKKK